MGTDLKPDDFKSGRINYGMRLKTKYLRASFAKLLREMHEQLTVGRIFTFGKHKPSIREMAYLKGIVKMARAWAQKEVK